MKDVVNWLWNPLVQKEKEIKNQAIRQQSKTFAIPFKFAKNEIFDSNWFSNATKSYERTKSLTVCWLWTREGKTIDRGRKFLCNFTYHREEFEKFVCDTNESSQVTATKKKDTHTKTLKEWQQQQDNIHGHMKTHVLNSNNSSSSYPLFSFWE